MKTMTCKELGGGCDLAFNAETFDQIAELSKAHGMEMHQQQDAAHLQAMEAMRSLMQKPQDMQKWFEEKQQAFENLPHSE